MLGTTEELKAFGIGALDDLGLGRMAPFVKLGLDSMEGDRRELDEEIHRVIAKFDKEFAAKASKMPPLGKFQSIAEGKTPLTSRRLSEILRTFNVLIGKSGGPRGENGFDALRKVFGAVNLLYQTFNDYRQFSQHAASSTFSNIRM